MAQFLLTLCCCYIRFQEIASKARPIRAGAVRIQLMAKSYRFILNSRGRLLNTLWNRSIFWLNQIQKCFILSLLSLSSKFLCEEPLFLVEWCFWTLKILDEVLMTTLSRMLGIIKHGSPWH